MDKTDMYFQRRLVELEKRIEKVEAQIAAQQMQNTGDYYTVQQMAEALHVCDQTIKRRLKTGMIEGHKVGKYWRIPKSELDQIFD